jgi:hypothetical protein
VAALPAAAPPAIAATLPGAPIYGTCFGYLQKLSSGRGLSAKTWQRRWFVVRSDGSVTYFHTAKDSTAPGAECRTVDLRGFDFVRSFDSQRPFAFKGALTGHRPLMLAADSEKDRTRWLDALAAAVAMQGPRTADPPPTPGQRLAAAAAAAAAATAATVAPSAPAVPVSPAPASDARPGSAAPLSPLPPLTAGPACQGPLRQATPEDTWAPVHASLADDMLSLFATPSSSAPTLQLHLPGCFIDFPDTDGSNRVFMVSKNGAMVLMLAADTDERFSMWVSSVMNSAQKRVA